VTVLPGQRLCRFPAGGNYGLAAEQGVWTWPQAMITPDPGVQRVELYVGDATRGVSPDRVRDIVTALTAS
jgi:hypothetical protein